MTEHPREDGYTLSMQIGFWLAAAANLIGAAGGVDLLGAATKPFLMLFLFCWAWQVLGRPKDRAGRWLLAGILFAWAGDVLLMFAGPGSDGQRFFLLGIAAFFGMQVCYVVAFLSVRGRHLLARRWWLVLPFVAYWVAMNWLLDPGALRIPVLAYSAVLVGMSATALDLTPRLRPSQAWPLFAGSVLFVVSDSLIASGEFGGLDLGRWQDFAVMATYVVAQFLIVTRFGRGRNLLATAAPVAVAEQRTAPPDEAGLRRGRVRGSAAR